MITDFLKSCYWEFLSYFVPERQSYEITGNCNKCGKCCETIYAAYMYSEDEFKLMQKIFPSYKRFYIKYKDTNGNLVFGCKYLTEENLCGDYENRPSVCKKYPQKRLAKYAEMPDGCGYKVNKKHFKDYLE